MASSLALRKVTGGGSTLFNKLVNPIHSASILRSFTTKAQIITDVFEVGMVEGGSRRRNWEFKEDGDGLQMRIEMPPGVSKENVKICVEHYCLIIKAEGKMEWSSEDKLGPKFSSRHFLEPHIYNINQIKARMNNNGVLKLTVPKFPGMDWKDAFQVN